ncbi:MAG: hypothetical protein HY393_02240 [Candidatus Diapherotrites archaeon]|nr:hypothetical protein [Candidatus Diapherotrites archaeon]
MARPVKPKTPRGAVASGWHRAVYKHGQSLVKKPFDYYTARFLAMNIRLPMSIRALKRYGVKDMNLAEWNHYQRYFKHLPANMRPYFARLTRLAYTTRGKKKRSWLYVEPVLNANGELSQTMADHVKQHGRIHDPAFWDRFSSMVKWMLQQKIPFFDFNAHNIVVQRHIPRKWVPVMVDYKSASLRPYWVHVWLRNPKIRAQRMIRLANRTIRVMGGAHYCLKLSKNAENERPR